jgi:hypothetical protein
VKSEYAEWRTELETPPKPTIGERVARWFNRPSAEEPAEQEMFVWKDVGELFR